MASRIIFLLSILTAVLATRCTTPRTLLFVGSYTDGLPAKGLKVFEVNVNTGASILLSEVADIINPSFLRISDDGNFLFVISESQLESHGVVSSYTVDAASGELTLVNKQSTLGRNPVHVELSPDQKRLLVSNYTDASLSLYNIDQEGKISNPIQHLIFQDSSIVKGRQDASHIHSSSFSKDGNYVYAHDLGGDKIRTFRLIDTLDNEHLPDVDINPGSGPRHFTFDKNGNYAYLLSELSGDITAFEFDGTNGQLTAKGKFSTYGQEQDIYRAADIHISPVRDVLYVSNRGPEENTIVAFKILNDGQLEFMQRIETEGDHPRNFAIDPSGSIIIVANQFSNNVVLRRVDKKTGLIQEVLSAIDFDKPSAIQFRQY